MSDLTFVPLRDEFLVAAKTGNVVPVYVEIVSDSETPISAFQKIGGEGNSFLFESAEHNEESGRFSFVGIEPRLILQSCGRSISIEEQGSKSSWETTRDPLAELEDLMARYRFVPRAELPRFAGGAVGFLGYDTVRFTESTVGLSPPDDLQLPEMIFMLTSTLLIFDHRFRRLKVLVNAFIDNEDAGRAYDIALEKIKSVIARLAVQTKLALIDTQAETVPRQTRCNTSRDEFEAMVEKAREYIAAGDVFQVVLSQRFETDFKGDALDLYRCLRLINPSPYMFCLRFGSEFSLVGSSPELHVRVANDVVEIRPIAGTRPRGNAPAQDEANAKELLADPKECAEHVMLIDLGRNDLGRVAEFGTVRVTEKMVIEHYSHVMHIGSHVVAKLRGGQNAFDAVRATFPAGTVSGAPKIRAMQIINELEKNKRGCYAGIVGYFGFDGSVDSCITLRSVVLKNGVAYVQAGAGIVADSVPAAEYTETVNKAMAMMKAIARAAKLSR